MSATLDRKLHQAAAALAAGDLARAERLSREVLGRAPRHPHALQLAAAARLQQEDGEGAGELLRRALESDPNNVQLLEGLGVAALKAKDFAAAESWLRRAVGSGKASAAAQSWLGLALSGQGRREEAADAFRHAAVATPDDPGVHLNLGHELMWLRQWDEAVPSYERALRLRPDYPEALNSLGSALRFQGRFDDAIDRFRRAAHLQPEYAEAHNNLGIALSQIDRDAEAEAPLRSALALAPDNADYHTDMANVLAKLQRWQEAFAHYEQALKLRPDSPETLNSFGSALLLAGKPAEALAPIQQAIALKPDDVDAHDNLGCALVRVGREEEANASFRQAIALKPDEASHYFRFGNALLEEHRFDEAIAHYDRALALDPGYVKAHYGLSLARLFRGEFESAWPGYERRVDSDDFGKKHFRANSDAYTLYERLRRWQGPADPGARDVAIWAEQGIGDQVLYSTLIPDLVATGVPFLYEVDRRLLPAYQRAFPQARFINMEEPPRKELQEMSRALAAGSLPGLFRPTRADFARQPEKLLAALPERVAHYRERLSALGPGPKIALSWRSARKDWWVMKKTTALADFAALLKCPGAHFLDVQYGDTAAERVAVEAAEGVRLSRLEGVDYFNDLEELLAILEACDMVITTSNATAHLAGALGKRTWLIYLANRAPFHYWADSGSHRSLWYPAVEIVTAPELTEWPPLIARLRDRLEHELAGDGAGADGSRVAAGRG